MSFEDFLFLALVAILFNGVDPLQPSWISDQHNFSSFQSKVILLLQCKFRLKATKGLGRDVEKLIFKTAAVVAILEFLSAYLAILCQLGALMLIIKFRFN